MTIGAPLWRRVLFLLLTFSFTGCSQFKRSSLEEEKDPHYLEGTKRAKAMDWDGAIDSFERALQSNPHNAAAHLELGILYDRHRNDYAAAIYHYERHLALRTNSPVAEVVKQNITGCTREMAKSVPYAVITHEVQRDLERLSQTNALLKSQLERLQSELARRPQYVTNYVTNWAAVPQFDKRGTSRLTQPAQQVPSPSDQQEIADPRAPDVPKPAETSAHAARPKPSSNSRNAPQHGAPALTANGRSPVSNTASLMNSSKPQSVHTVRPGETLAALADNYGISLKELKAANPAAANGVRAGQKIIIPGK